MLLLLSLLLLPLPPLSYYFATKHFAVDTKSPGVVELTTQLLILENILWLPLCQINKFRLNTLPSKAVAIPYTCGLSVIASTPEMERQVFLLQQHAVVVTALSKLYAASPLSIGRAIEREFQIPTHLLRVTSHDPEDFLIHFTMPAHKDL